MINLKTLCLLFLLFGFFVSCSSAQHKVVPPPMTPVDSLTSAKYNAETKKFESTGGKFSIDIPQTPVETRDLGTETANKKGIDVGKIFLWQFSGKAIYTVMYKNNFSADGNPLEFDGDPKTQNIRDLATLEAYMREGIVTLKAKLISEKPISYKDHKGTEFRYFSVDGVTFVGRVYSINSVNYQIVGGYGDDKYEKEVLEVLDSFTLLSDKK